MTVPNRSAAAAADESVADREVVITRTFSAPRELVFDAFTDPSHVGQWWGPDGFTTTTERIDIRPGGTWTHVMHGPDGTDYPNFIVYDEVVRPERLTWAHGTVEGEPPAFHSTVTFEVDGVGTRVTLRSVFPTKAARDFVVREHGAIEGGEQTLQRLGERLAAVVRRSFTDASDRELVATRVFAAPRELVFDAFTRPEHVREWYGCSTQDMVVCEVDLRPGGRFRYVLRMPEGEEFAFGGEYLELVRPEFIVNTLGMEAMPGHEAVERSDFLDSAGGTLLVMRTTFRTAADYRGWAESGGATGMESTLDRLAEVVQRLAVVSAA
ncbi:MAG TPA: SRPBCC domain-containing protein [Longimicrobiales bacterium]|nr:SRPBCC domain-containing protein [Longimicrobiales bacterium]